jgi:hypothetical protein
LDFRDGIGHASIPEVVMRPLHRVLLVLAALVAFQGIQACASETQDPGLSPQPLPPETGDTVRNPEEQEPSKSTGGGAGGSSSSGSSSGTTGPGPGVNDGDAGDGGTDGGDN